MASQQLQRAIESGLIQHIGAFRLELGGAVVNTDVYRTFATGPAGENEIHLEGDIPSSTMNTRWGNISVEAERFHAKTTEQEFSRMVEAAKNSAGLLKLGSWMTGAFGGKRPLLTR